MNGVHDAGGCMGFGPVVAEIDEPVFRATWEARVFAMANALGKFDSWTLDEDRHACENRPPREYLRLTYYHIWLEALSRLLVEKGMVSSRELRTGKAERMTAVDPLTAEEAKHSHLVRNVYSRNPSTSPRFEPGQPVRARNMHPQGHTRLPRYLRGHTGKVVAVHGVHVFPDSNAHGRGEDPQWLYTVRFAARELWGHESNDTVNADLWEPYLEPV